MRKAKEDYEKQQADILAQHQALAQAQATRVTLTVNVTLMTQHQAFTQIYVSSSSPLFDTLTGSRPKPIPKILVYASIN